MGAFEITCQLNVSDSIPVVRRIKKSYPYVETVRYPTFQSAIILALIRIPRWFLNTSGKLYAIELYVNSIQYRLLN
jgi:hypothetical protein